MQFLNSVMDKIFYQSCLSAFGKELSQEYILTVLPICVHVETNNSLRLPPPLFNMYLLHSLFPPVTSILLYFSEQRRYICLLCACGALSLSLFLHVCVCRFGHGSLFNRWMLPNEMQTEMHTSEPTRMARHDVTNNARESTQNGIFVFVSHYPFKCKDHYPT